jgi:hypothetical protein
VSIYDELNEDIVEMMSDTELGEGGDVEIQVWTEGVAADPARPLEVGPATITARYKSFAVSVGYNADRVEGQNKYIMQGDRQFIIAAGAIKDSNDVVTDLRIDQGMVIWRKDQNDSWEVISLETVEPTDRKLLFVCQGRQWPQRTM